MNHLTGLGLAIVVRLLQRVMSQAAPADARLSMQSHNPVQESLTYHLIVNVTMTLRFVGLALVLLRHLADRMLLNGSFVCLIFEFPLHVELNSEASGDAMLSPNPDFGSVSAVLFR